MPERFCPNCGEPVGDARFCPNCGEPLDAAPEAEEPEPETPPSSQDAEPPPPPPEEEAPPATEDDLGVAPDELESHGPHQEPEVAGETPLEQAAEDIRQSEAVAADGQRRCPYCGEAVYEGETVCWACKRRIEEPQEPQETEQGPVAEPEPGAPVARPSEAAPPSTASRPQAPPGAEPTAEARSYAWWSFGLGLVSVFTCGALGLLGIAAIWLGVIAHRKDAGPMAVAGIVFGALGLLMLLAWIIGLALMLPGWIHSGPTHVLAPFTPWGGGA